MSLNIRGWFSRGTCLLVAATLATGTFEAVRAQDSTAAWRRSFTQFLGELASWEGKKPAPSLQTFVDGQVVPLGEWEIMKKYSAGRVRWTAVFDSVGKASETHPSQGLRVVLKLDGGDKVAAVVAYSSKENEAAWRSQTAGSAIQFEGRIVGIQFDFIPIRGGITSYWVTVFDSKPVGPKR